MSENEQGTIAARQDRPRFHTREIVAQREPGGLVQLSAECHLATCKCGEQCVQFEWKPPGTDHRHYQARLWCTGRTIIVRMLEEKAPAAVAVLMLAAALLSGCSVQCGSDAKPHDWGRWTDQTNMTEAQCIIAFGSYKVQERACRQCGLEELHAVR